MALRYKKEEQRAEEREQYQLFDTPEYIHRVFVTDMEGPSICWCGSTISARGRRT